MSSPVGTAAAPFGTELLDDPDADPAAVRLSLGNIARANRWFGGTAALRWALAQLTRGVPRGARLTLLDLGTGAGDLPIAARRWGRRRGLDIVPVGLELSRVAAALARGAGVPTFVARATEPPVKAGSVDIVLVSQLAHHLPADCVVSLFEQAHRASRGAVIVLDLRRAAVARVAFRAGATLLRFDPVTVHDGLVSIRRGYTAAELRALARRAGVPAAVSRRPGCRLVAMWGHVTAPVRH